MYTLFPRKYDKQAWRAYKRGMAYFIWIYAHLSYEALSALWASIPRRYEAGKVVAKEIWGLYTELWVVAKLLVVYLIKGDSNAKS